MTNGDNSFLAGARKAAGGLAVLAALAASASSYQTAAEVQRQNSDAFGADAATRRLEAARAQLPLRGKVAYLSDLPEKTGGVVFMAAGYALAPVLLVPAEKDPGIEWALGNFSRPLDYAAFGAPHGYAVVADLGNGVVLYRKGRR